jgi:hypothetical protein
MIVVPKFTYDLIPDPAKENPPLGSYVKKLLDPFPSTMVSLRVKQNLVALSISS